MSESLSSARVALVHEWLVEWGGSEDVSRQMLECVPQAKVFSTIDFLSPESRKRLGASAIHTTFLQKAPGIRNHFWRYLPLTPLAVERHDLRGCDIVLSSSHACAKGALCSAEQLHVSYVHSPMRYAWDLHHAYMEDYGYDRGPLGLIAAWIFHRLREWDRNTAHNVDLFIANSNHVRDRIWRCYRRPARVIYPPVRTESFAMGSAPKDDFYVTVSRLVNYKRIDVMLDAFRQLPSRKLVVIGDGPEMARLKSRCPPNVTLLGFQPHDVVQQHLQAARAFIFSAHEDFGIAPVEAQACGTPVIAYGVGGSLETVSDGSGGSPRTGVFFPEQTAASLAQAVEAFEAAGAVFDPHACRAWAERFSEARFRVEFADAVSQALELWRSRPGAIERSLATFPEGT